MCQGKMCGVGGGCSGHGCWHRAIRLILGIAIILIVFCLGMMIGQLKGELNRGSGYRMMHTQSYYGGGYGYAVPMMQGGAPVRSQTAPATQAAPAANQ
jgi:hypothetical protein